MDLVLVFPLILIFVSSKESYSVATVESLMCTPGYYKGKNELGHDICKQCEKHTYTAINNSVSKCLACGFCQYPEKEIKACTFSSNVVCECKDGYYNPSPGLRICTPCNCYSCQEPKNDISVSMCESCKRQCMTDPECKRKCTIPALNGTTSPDLSTKSQNVTATPMNVTLANRTNSPDVTLVKDINVMSWLYLLVVVVIFGMLYMLLMHGCSCLSTNKEVALHPEDPKLIEKCSHQSRDPTTLTFTISEEAPIMALSHSPAQPHQPNAKQEDVRHEEQSERWPAIVLYAIIKQVPLRRWKEFLRLLSVGDQQLERVELETGLGLGYMEKQYHMLRLWSQRSTASLDDVFSALHYMDLSGCAQLLQESLEKLQ